MVEHSAERAHVDAIVRRVYEYAWGIDLRDWDLHRSIYVPEITMDFSSWNGRKSQTLAADEWVAGLRPLFTGLDATQHVMTNPLVDIDSDGRRARCRMYMQAVHILEDWPEPEFTIGGWYDDHLVRTDTGWLIDAVTLTVSWRRGDQSLMVEAARRGASRLAGD